MLSAPKNFKNNSSSLRGTGSPCSRIFQAQDELLGWAEEERLRNLAEGWS